MKTEAMVFQPGQSGNPGGKANEKIWRDALRRAVLRKEREEDPLAIEKLADKCIAMALDGDITAIKEIGNRMDGMPAQQQIHTGDEDGGPLRIEHSERVIIDPQHPDSPSV